MTTQPGGLGVPRYDDGEPNPAFSLTGLPESTPAMPPGRSWSSPSRRRIAKAVMDRVGALVLLVVAALWLLLIALAVKLDSPGPVLCRQRRVGQWGREFSLLRFRTAAPGTDDPTPLGRLLRRCSLDELPQLFNVLGGSMSFVGPRPLLPGATAEPAGDRLPLVVKPGLTGLWYLSSSRRVDADRPDEIAEYARTSSLGQDLGIIWRSLWSAVRNGG